MIRARRRQSRWQPAATGAAPPPANPTDTPQPEAEATVAFQGEGQPVGSAENDTVMHHEGTDALGKRLRDDSETVTSDVGIQETVVGIETRAAKRKRNAITDDPGPGETQDKGVAEQHVEEDERDRATPVLASDLTSDDVEYDRKPTDLSGISAQNMILRGSRQHKPPANDTNTVTVDNIEEEYFVGSMHTTVSVVFPTDTEGWVNCFFILIKRENPASCNGQVYHARNESWPHVKLTSVFPRELDMTHYSYRMPFVRKEDDKPRPLDKDFQAWMRKKAEKQSWKQCQKFFHENAAKYWPQHKDDSIQRTISEMEENLAKWWERYIKESRTVGTHEKFIVQKDFEDEHMGDKAPEREHEAIEKRENLISKADEAELAKYSTLLQRISSTEARNDESAVEEVFLACGGPSEIMSYQKRLKWLGRFSDEFDAALLARKNEAEMYPALLQIQTCLREEDSETRLMETNATLCRLDESQRKIMDGFLRRRLPSNKLETADGHVKVTNLTQDEAAMLAHNIHCVYESIFGAESECDSAYTKIDNLCRDILMALWDKNFTGVTDLLQKQDAIDLPEVQMEALKTALHLPENFKPGHPTSKSVLSGYKGFLQKADDKTLSEIKTDVSEVPRIVSEEDEDNQVHAVNADKRVVEAIPRLVEAVNERVGSDLLRMPGSFLHNVVDDMRTQINVLGTEVVDVVSRIICDLFKADKALMVAVWKALIETELSKYDLLFHQSGGVITTLHCVLEVGPDGVLLYCFPPRVVQMLQNIPDVPAITTLRLYDVVREMQRGQILQMSHKDCGNIPTLELRDFPVATTVIPYAGQNKQSWWVGAEQRVQSKLSGPQGRGRRLNYSNVFTVIGGTPVVHSNTDEFEAKVVELVEQPTENGRFLLVTAADGGFFQNLETGNCLVVQFGPDVWHVTVQKTAEGTPTLEIAQESLQFFLLSELEQDFLKHNPHAPMISKPDAEGKVMVHQAAYELVLNNCTNLAEDWNMPLNVVLSMVAIKHDDKDFKLTPNPFLLPAGTTGPVHGLTDSGEKTAKKIVRKNVSAFSEAVVGGLLGGAEMSRVLNNLLVVLNQYVEPTTKSKKPKRGDAPALVQLAMILAGHDVEQLKQADYDWLVKLWTEENSGQFDFATKKFSSGLANVEAIICALTTRRKTYYEENELDAQTIISYLTETGVLMVEALVKSNLVATRMDAVSFMDSFSIRHEATTAHHMIGNENGMDRFDTEETAYVDCLPHPLNDNELQALQTYVDIPGYQLMSSKATQAELFLPILQEAFKIVSATYQAHHYISSEGAVGMWPVKGPNVIDTKATERHWRDNVERDEEWKLSDASITYDYALRALTDDRVYGALKDLAEKKTEARELVKKKVKGTALITKQKEVADALLALLKYEHVEPENHVRSTLMEMTEAAREQFEHERKMQCEKFCQIGDEEIDYENIDDEVTGGGEDESESDEDESDSHLGAIWGRDDGDEMETDSGEEFAGDEGE